MIRKRPSKNAVDERRKMTSVPSFRGLVEQICEFGNSPFTTNRGSETQPNTVKCQSLQLPSLAILAEKCNKEKPNLFGRILAEKNGILLSWNTALNAPKNLAIKFEVH